MFSPKMFKTGDTLSNVSLSPAAIMLSKPSFAWAGVRPRGASIIPAPFAARSAPIFRVEAGIDVPKSMTTAPLLIPARMPSSPYIRPSTTSDVVRHSIMMSQAAANSLPEVALRAPRLTTAATASLFRSMTIGSNPFFCRHSTILPPIRPRPTKPITGFFMSLLLSECLVFNSRH